MTPSLFNPDALIQRLREKQRFPVNTYRFQLHRSFTFQDATAIVPYLARLGITDCYCSPYLLARPGSTHGYDICDHSRLNPEIGSEADYEAFVNALWQHQMGQVLDFVPNHMGVDTVGNPWWRNMLESGPASPHARFFDVNWNPVKPELRGKILLPVLGDHYGLVLDRGELRLAFQDNSLVVFYFDHNFPIDPGQWARVFGHNLERLQDEMKEDDPNFQEFLSIVRALEHLPASWITDAAQIAARQNEIGVTRDRLKRVLEADARIGKHLEEIIAEFNGQPGQPESFDRLHQLLESLPYRLAFWRTAFQEINYRRFFDINDLAGIRMEDPAVFEATHPLILRLIRGGKITGLRMDHIDGLFDPEGYLEKLQERILLEWATEMLPSEQEPKEEWRQEIVAWRQEQKKKEPGGVVEKPFYVLAEKILSGSEILPPSWPLHGTSGYDFTNDLNRLFVPPQQAREMKKVYERFTEQMIPFHEMVYETKKLVTETALASELNVLAHTLNRISEEDRRTRDFTLDSLREALREVVACFPVYRTYVSETRVTETDQQLVDVALVRARAHNPAMEPTVFDFIRRVLLPQRDGDGQGTFKRFVRFAMMFQQYTGPVQAKGLEDTSFYRYNVLMSLNEVGGDPQRFGGMIGQFHESNRQRRDNWPCTMLATSTHDTKRGEDVRARLNVLAEVPEEWKRQVSAWAKLNAKNRTTIDGVPAPDRNDEYLFYQSLVGAWPAEPADTAYKEAPAELIERLTGYMLKAIKEAKVHSSWINPNQNYDQAVSDFVSGTLAGAKTEQFLSTFLPFQRRIAPLGMINSLAQLVLKMVSPGVPDFYQGTELWDLTLVDPDNRRPVDYSFRQQLLDELEPYLNNKSPQPAESQIGKVKELLEHWYDGRVKLWLTACGARLRRSLPGVFLQGDYLPLEVVGDRSEHAVAVGRRHEGHTILAVVPRLVMTFSPGQELPTGPGVWQKTRIVLPTDLNISKWQNLLTNEQIEIERGADSLELDTAKVLGNCPVALLQGGSA